MNIAVLKYQFIANKPSGIPNAWPAETIKLVDSTTLPGENWVLMTEEELDTYLSNNRSDYNSWEVNLHLDDNKKRKIQEIDKKTTEIISRGFIFDGHAFSLSLAAQLNWSGLVTLESLLTWPMTITTIDDGAYSLSQANLLYFIGTGKNLITSTLDSGRTLKIAINSSTTQEELNAIIDSR